MIRRILFFLALFLPIVFGDEHNHVYADKEQVVLWMNTVGPYRNRQETYPFFSLPLCRGHHKKVEHNHETLGEALLGVDLEFSGLDIRFKVDVTGQTVCDMVVDESAYEQLKHAILNKYWYQMYLDDLPLWNVIGETTETNELLLWTHKIFHIGYNGNQIIKVGLENREQRSLRAGARVTFTYSIQWHASSTSFERRFDDYLDFQFFQHKIHWFSIFNSFMMVLFLVAVVCMILLRTLRRDYARYNREEGLNDLDRELGDEYGWKQVHSDVFRPPPMVTLLASVVGSGVHMAVVAIVVLFLALANQLYAERGGFISVALFVFAATSPMTGFVGGGLYSRLSGKRWIRQFLCGAILIPGLVCTATFFVNLVAMYYHTSRAISFLTMLAVLSIVLFVVIPLNLVGTVLGRNLCGQSNYPCRVSSVPRPIPEKKWFMEPAFLILSAGILPFGSIFIELYFVFTSFWAYKIYFVFSFTLLVLLLLLAVTSSVSAVGTYFLLNSEDYRWQWTSVLSGASISIYAYMYSMYYFMFKTKMNGLFQTTFYFSHMALFCIGLGILCGAISYLAASWFVRKIYSTVKVD